MAEPFSRQFDPDLRLKLRIRVDRKLLGSWAALVFGRTMLRTRPLAGEKAMCCTCVVPGTVKQEQISCAAGRFVRCTSFAPGRETRLRRLSLRRAGDAVTP